MPNERNYQRHANAIVIRGEAVGSTLYDYFPRRPMIALGTIQIICGAMLIALIIAGIVTGQTNFFSGIHGSIMAILAGSFAVAAGTSKTACKVAANLVFSVLAANASCGLVFIAVLSIYQERKLPQYYGYSRTGIALLVIPVVMTIVSAIEAIGAIISSVISCHFVCLCCKNCCCECNVTKTQLLIVNNDCSSELTQLLTVPVAVNVVQSSVNGNEPQAFATTAAAANKDPPPDYKQVADTF